MNFPRSGTRTRNSKGLTTFLLVVCMGIYRWRERNGASVKFRGKGISFFLVAVRTRGGGGKEDP